MSNLSIKLVVLIGYLKMFFISWIMFFQIVHSNVKQKMFSCIVYIMLSKHSPQPSTLTTVYISVTFTPFVLWQTGCCRVKAAHSWGNKGTGIQLATNRKYTSFMIINTIFMKCILLCRIVYPHVCSVTYFIRSSEIVCTECACDWLVDCWHLQIHR